jgi:hypothetical protein
MRARCALLAFAVVGMLGGSTVPAGAATLAFGPASHEDAADAPEAPLDVRSVAFGQRETELVLALRAHAPWLTHDVVRPGRSLCLELERGAPARAVGRLCLGTRHGRAVLRSQRVDGLGRASRWRQVDAAVARPDARSLRARFTPRAVGLSAGSVRWHLAVRWQRRGLCAAGCEERVPDAGSFGARVGVLGEPACFGAAALGTGAPCSNPALRDVVIPAPRDAPLLPDAPCRILPRPAATAVMEPCAFGVLGSDPTGTVALVGDSHARVWRAALEVVAQARGWRGVSITRPGCPFSVQIPRSPALGPGACAQLHGEIVAWLRANPQVRTVFVASWAEPAAGPQGGIGGYGGGPPAFGAMLDRVPASVRHVYVLRDVPGTPVSTPGCVAAAQRQGRRPAEACAVPRSAALVADPAAQAAAARAPRMRVIDLTRHFCDARRCYPVVGGAYVYKDDNHMNSVFATSLGPFVLRALNVPEQQPRDRPVASRPPSLPSTPTMTFWNMARRYARPAVAPSAPDR